MERLIGSIQPYAWGDPSLLADLQGRTPSGEPEAELWMGAHAVAPSRLAETDRSLLEAVEAEPDAVLGPRVEERFGRFPYLLKVLAAAQPLSIQVHPSLEQAKAGFAREDAAGVALDSPSRSYRDDNHKPELLCALTPFEAKCGFRSPDETLLVIDALLGVARSTGLVRLRRELAAGGEPAARLAGALEWLMLRPDASVLVADLLAAADLLLQAELPPGLAPYRPDLVWLATLDGFYPGDVGIVVSLLLNHVVLAPGQAMFLAAGNMHSYLRGAGVELMANSDNVIRGGLTVKHIDVDELLQVVDTRPGLAPVQTARPGCHRFESPVPEFSLTRLESEQCAVITPAGPEIVLVTEGRARLEAVDSNLATDLVRGESAFVAWSDGPYRLIVDPDAMAWRSAVGDLLLS